MKHLLRIWLSFLMVMTGVPTGALAQTTNKQAEFNSVLGADYNTNLVVNPSAAKNLNNTSGTGVTINRDTTSGNRIAGIASFQLVAGSNNGVASWPLISPVGDLASGNCMFKGRVKGDASLWVAEVLDGSTVKSALRLQNTGTQYMDFVLPVFNCTMAGIPTVQLRATVSSAATINVGKLFYGKADNISYGVPNNVFSAKSAAVGTVTDEGGGDWITGNCTKSGGASQFHDCTFSPSAGFTIAPNCVVTPFDATTSLSSKVRAVSATSITIESTVTSTGAGASTAINLTCTRAGTDFIQPAITPNQWNFTQNYGAMTIGSTGTPPTKPNTGITADNVTGTRIGRYFYVTYKYTQTVTTGAANGTGDYLLTIPGGYQVDTSEVPVFTGAITGASAVSSIGVGSRQDGATSIIPHAFLYSSTQFRMRNDILYTAAVFWGAGSGSLAGNPVISFSITIRVPIQGWTENQNAPQLLGSVTSNAQNALRMEYLEIASPCSVSPCTIGKQSGAFTSVTRAAAGTYPMNYPAGTWSSPPVCTCTSSLAGVNGAYCSITDTGNSTSKSILSIAPAGNSTDVNGILSVICIGPR